jgi:hypothetical protein
MYRRDMEVFYHKLLTYLQELCEIPKKVRIVSRDQDWSCKSAISEVVVHIYSTE